MKKLLIIASIFLSSSLFCNELAWVNEQVEAIKPARKGMSLRTLASTEDPFVFLKKVKTEKKASAPSRTTTSAASKQSTKKSKQRLTLSLIMNNRAMINNTWYKKGDTVNGYKVKEIDFKSVLLTKKKKKLLLSTKSSNTNLKFNNK